MVAITQQLNATFSLYKRKDGKWGALQDGKWDGMFENLVYGKYCDEIIHNVYSYS